MRMELLPGMTVRADFDQEQIVERILGPLFLTDGLVLSQVSQLTGLEPYMVQNWVKRGYVAPPRSKKYSRRQFCRIVIINFLKDSFRLESIVRLMSYINNDLADESDDRVDDSLLYAYFVEALSMLTAQQLYEGETAGAIEKATLGFTGEQSDAKERLEQVIAIMLAAYGASRLKNRADRLLNALEQ